MGESYVATQAIATLSACIAAISGGFHVGWALPSMAKLEYRYSGFYPTADQSSRIFSVFTAASVVGALSAALVVNKVGRKLPLLSTTILYVVSCVLIATARDSSLLIFARFVAGLGFGATATILPIYVGEIADDRYRGALGVLIGQMLNLGILLAYSIGPWVSREILAGVGLLLPIIFALSFFSMPESPYFLMMNKDTEAAERSLSWLRMTNGVKGELIMIDDNIKIQETETFTHLITTPENRKALMILTVLMLAAPLTGINQVFAYIDHIFEASGSFVGFGNSLIIIGAVLSLSGWFSVFTVDSIGRRRLMMVSLCGSTVCLSAVALCLQFQYWSINYSLIFWLPMTAAIGYTVFYAIGLGCIPFVIISEVLPYNMKAVGTTYAVFIWSLGTIVAADIYQLLGANFKAYMSFWVYAGCSVFTTLAIFAVLPETKRKSFCEIQDKLRGTSDLATATYTYI